MIGRARGFVAERRLTRRELQSVYLAALRLPGKLISAELGISATSVRALTASALRKLGLRSGSQPPALWLRLDLAVEGSATAFESEPVVFGAALVIHEPAPGLTGAERDVLGI